MVPKFVEPMSWEWSATPGTDQRPLCTSGTVITEHTVDWRCARSLLRSACARATEEDTTLCEEPVSTTKLPRATGEADRQIERHVTRSRGHGERHDRPAFPLEQGRRWRARRTGVRRRLSERRSLRSGHNECARVEVDPDPTESRQDVGTEQAVSLALPAHLGQCGCRQLLRRQSHAV